MLGIAMCERDHIGLWRSWGRLLSPMCRKVSQRWAWVRKSLIPLRKLNWNCCGAKLYQQLPWKCCWGSYCGCLHYCEITNCRRILNWGDFVCSFLPFFFFNVDCCVGQNKELLSARHLTSLVWCFHTLSCCASAYSHSFLLPRCRLENQLLHRKCVFVLGKKKLEKMHQLSLSLSTSFQWTWGFVK